MTAASERMTASHDDPAAPGSGSRSFAVFAFLWALALLSHQVHYRDAFRSIPDLALTGSALFLLLTPSSAWSLLAAAAFHVLAVVYQLPDVFNHWFFSSLGSLAFVVIAIAVWLRNRRLDPADLFAPFAAVARVNLICLYYFSGFHKLNADYFSLDVSCGASAYGQLRDALPWLPASSNALWVATFLGIAMELSLPTLLITRRWRRLGVALACVFHFGLGLMGFRRFSMISFALVTLFLPELPAVVTRAVSPLERFSVLHKVVSALRERKWLLLAAVFAVGAALLGVRGEARILAGKLGDLAALTFSFIFLAESVLLTVVSFYVLSSHRFAKGPALGFLPAVRSGLLVIALMVLSGAAPYLGLQTLNTFAMYSNLRTEGGATNHFLVPAGLQVFGYQRDLIDIITTDITGLQGVVDHDMLLPYQQLLVEIEKEVRKGRKGIHVAFQRDGQTLDTASAEDHPQLGRGLNGISYRFLNFRAIEKSGRRACTY